MDGRGTPAGAFAHKIPPKGKIAIDEQTGEKYMSSGRGNDFLYSRRRNRINLLISRSAYRNNPHADSD